MFPVINHINDVLPAIEGRDEILVADRGTHTVINYLVVYPDTFPPLNVAGGSAKMRAERKLHNAIRRECRGMLFDKEGNIIRRPLHKFFNINEREETLAKNIDLSRPHVILEKLDGSSISAFWLDGGLQFGTRMGPTEISDQALNFAMANDQYITYCNALTQTGYTPIFEWCSRSQRIVIDHPEDRLVLLAVRNNVTGVYLPYLEMCHDAQAFGIPCVQPVAVGYNGSTDDLVEIVRNLPMDQYGEGIVIRFDDGEMVKLKCDEYCLIHKAKERILEERYVVEDIINGDIDDVMATVLEDDQKDIERYRGLFWDKLDQFVEFVGQRVTLRHKQYPNRKDYALSKEQKEDSKFVTNAVFWFYQEQVTKNSVRDYVLEKRIRPNLGTRTKFGEMKNEVLSGIRYKY